MSFISKENTVCLKCKGTGWQARESEFICTSCNDCNKTCYLCENVNKSNWVDCTACYGEGIIKIKIKNKVESNTIYESH